jgi:hypothetical protein
MTAPHLLDASFDARQALRARHVRHVGCCIPKAMPTHAESRRSERPTVPFAPARRGIAPRMAALVCVLVAAAACKSLTTGARDTFAESYTCPPSRVVVTERPDIAAHTLRPQPAPPDGVANDPDRLAYWREEQAEANAHADGAYDVFEVDGCGARVVYACEHLRDRGRTYTDCSQQLH